MSNFPGAYRAIPLWTFVVIPIFFICVVLFTEIRYNLDPPSFIGHATTIASLVIGFIFLYAMQKYDMMDLNVPIVTRNLTYLMGLADKYDPSLVCYLERYAEGFLNFCPNDFSLHIFEEKLLKHVKTENTRISIHDSVRKLEDVYEQRISGTNIIAEPIWYLIFIMALLLTLIFPLDMSFRNRIDSVIIIILIWLPITAIYFIYLTEISNLDKALNDIIKMLKKECIISRNRFNLSSRKKAVHI
jgi:hypothetical protein